MKCPLLVVCCVGSAVLLGCGQQKDMSKSLEKANKTQFAIKTNQTTQGTPEFILDHAESHQEKANYLKGLTKDEKFDPKQHLDMLKKYENDSNADVSEAAKELLAKAQ
jgi:hypothetical protein